MATSLRPKHVPQRTCVGCGSVAAKRTLIRVVRGPAGDVQPDPAGKRPGRGAYLCSNRECWERAIAKGRLARSLRSTISPGDAQALRSYAAGLGLATREPL